MAAENRDRNDVILMPRQYAMVKDTTKGNITVNVGPTKVTISDSDRLMAPDPKNPTRLVEVSRQDDAILPYVDVGESDYVVLTNPPTQKDNVPKVKTMNEMAELQFGRRINIPGPISFPLWPFQAVDVIKGHQLSLNQYLVVKVINDEEALKNWDKAITKAAEGTPTPGTPGTAARGGIPKPPTLAVGQQIIIQGTKVSFYIPPTGLEVMKDPTGNYVRDAVTLEQLEYCVLVDQNGEKRFERGPMVVFPAATEAFVEEENSLKFRATELTEISGLHIKVTAPYKEGEKQFKIGDEMFITGKDNPIYFPRAEHALVKYGDRVKHYATAVPKGEGRYMMNRLNGVINLVRGPKMLLPDPRVEVIVRRILSEKAVELLFPGNTEAKQINQELTRQAQTKGLTGDYLSAYDEPMSFTEMAVSGAAARSYAVAAAAAPAPTRFVGDAMSRKETYTPPRTVTLNTKYDGAVQIDIWTGYAVLKVDRSGKREVVVGPSTVLLEFDENLANLEFSTGKPKTTEKLMKTPYLRVLNNQVSDIVEAQTSDDIIVRVKTSYRVNFLTQYKEKWFDVDNYVKLLCDHIRSKVRNAVKKMTIQDFTDQFIDVVRDTVLGKPVQPAAAQGAAAPAASRPGLKFEENGAHVYDVEVLGLEIGDTTIAQQLQQAQRQTISDALRLAQSKRQLTMAEEQENINQKLDEIKAETAIKAAQTQQQVLAEQTKLVIAQIESATEAHQNKQAEETERQKITDINTAADLQRKKAEADLELAQAKEANTLEIQLEQEATKAIIDRVKAITPDLIVALQAFGDKAMIERVAEATAPATIFGGKSVTEVITKILQGSGLERLTSNLKLGNGPATERFQQPAASR